VRLTPSSLKHLDQVKERLRRRGREVSRDELIRIAITLLTEEDVP
jgi:Arc/MetJ-type ribon-helix-helix transcriptional regulator